MVDDGGRSGSHHPNGTEYREGYGTLLDGVSKDSINRAYLFNRSTINAIHEIAPCVLRHIVGFSLFPLPTSFSPSLNQLFLNHAPFLIFDSLGGIVLGCIQQKPRGHQ
jgi:hypothetical protein